MTRATRTSCYAAVVAVGLLSLRTTRALLGGNPALSGRAATTNGFVVHLRAPSTDTTTALPVGGWDNDNFLESLGSGGGNAAEDNDAIDQANDEYYRHSKYGRPTVVDDNNEEWGNQQQQQPWSGNGNSNDPNPSFPTNSYAPTTSYADSLNQQHQQQHQNPSFPPSNTPSNNNNDMSSVTDAAAEIYSYSYNKNVGAAPPATESTNAVAPINSNSDAPRDELSSGEIEGAANSLSAGMVAKIKASHQDDREESSQGGSRFQGLMARAKDQEQTLSPAQQRTQNPLLDSYGHAATDAAQSNAAITPPSSIMTPDEIANLSVEEQARLYREFFYVQKQPKTKTQQTTQNQNSGLQQQQGQPKSMGSTSSNYLARGTGFDGRKIGHNRDSDIVSSSSDVYFARLKRDSTTRNLARYRGDDETANAVFHDPSIMEIEAPVNPYLVEQKKRMMNVVETVPEEMLVFREFATEDRYTDTEKSYSGISYRERMAKVQAERQKTTDQPPEDGNSGSGNNINPGNPYSY